MMSESTAPVKYAAQMRVKSLTAQMHVDTEESHGVARKGGILHIDFEPGKPSLTSDFDKLKN